DFNGDGSIDVAFITGSSTVTAMVHDGRGGFTSLTNFSTGDLMSFPPEGPAATSIAVGDFNNNGRADIVVTHHDGNTIAVLLDSSTPVPSITSPAAGSRLPGSATLSWSAPDGLPGAPVAEYW